MPKQMQAGERNNRLVAVRKTIVGTHVKSGRWLFRCDCGNHVEAVVSNVRSGHTKSCGCLNSEMTAARNHKHGAAWSKEWRAWRAMRQRCLDKNKDNFKYYGGRGVKIYPDWVNDFWAFFEHVGPAPSPSHSIDRIDVDGNYEPGNVRWATRSEQAKNQRRWLRPKEPAKGDGWPSGRQTELLERVGEMPA